MARWNPESSGQCGSWGHNDPHKWCAKMLDAREPLFTFGRLEARKAEFIVDLGLRCMGGGA